MASITELLDKLKNARATVELVGACGKRVCSSEEHWDCPYGNEGMTDCVDRLEAAYEDTIENLLQLAEAIPADVAPVVRWIPVTERLPEPETDVLAVCNRNGYIFVVPAIYEDGKMLTQDSRWNWCDIYCYGLYSEDADDYFVPEGWWENRQFNPDDVYNNPVDCPVTHWMPLPEPPEVGC